MEYEILSHVSETGIRAYGTSLNNAFANAARAMFSIITKVEKVETKQKKEIKLISSSPKELLVDFLNELLFYYETESMLFSDFKVRIESSTLVAEAKGEKYRPEKHPIKTQIKATTYYNLKVNSNEDNWVQVFFDV